MEFDPWVWVDRVFKIAALFFAAWKVMTPRSLPEVVRGLAGRDSQTQVKRTKGDWLMFAVGMAILVILAVNTFWSRDDTQPRQGASSPLVVGFLGDVSVGVLQLPDRQPQNTLTLPISVINTGPPTNVSWRVFFKRQSSSQFEEMNPLITIDPGKVLEQRGVRIQQGDLIQQKTLRGLRRNDATFGLWIGELPPGLNLDSARGGTIRIEYRSDTGPMGTIDRPMDPTPSNFK